MDITVICGDFSTAKIYFPGGTASIFSRIDRVRWRDRDQGCYLGSTIYELEMECTLVGEDETPCDRSTVLTEGSK